MKINNIEDIAEKIGVQIKKGFISALILLVLEIKPCHGYLIIKEIKERTLGLWKPTTSTIYPILEKLEKNELIISVRDESDKRQKKTYNITSTGKRILKILMLKYQRLMKSMKSIISSTVGLDKEFKELNITDEDILSYFTIDPTFNWSNSLTDGELIQKLIVHRKLITEKIQDLNKAIQNIDEYIVELNKKLLENTV